jgi:hypothetical protein
MKNIYFFDKLGICISVVTLDDLSIIDELCARIGADSYVDSVLQIPLRNARLVNDELVSIEPAVSAKIRWGEVREIRNLTLASCDWTSLTDAPLTESKRLEWAAYRQALRNVTSQTDPFNITWPTKPQ